MPNGDIMADVAPSRSFDIIAVKRLVEKRSFRNLFGLIPSQSAWFLVLGAEMPHSSSMNRVQAVPVRVLLEGNAHGYHLHNVDGHWAKWIKKKTRATKVHLSRDALSSLRGLFALAEQGKTIKAEVFNLCSIHAAFRQ